MNTKSEKNTIVELQDSKEAPMDLLELADPSIDQVNKYLKRGRCFVLKLDLDVIVGVMVLQEIALHKLEIKNIAVSEQHQGLGFGKLMLNFALDYATKSGYQKLTIATGNSSIGQLALYQKVGFEIVDIVKDYFIRNYSEPIFENGIICKHQIVLEKDILA